MIGIPEFVKAKKTERSLAQNAGSIALRTIPRSTLALLRETTKMLDGLITRLVPGSYQTVVKTTGAVGTGVMIGAVLPAVSMFDGGITAISLIAANKLGPKGAALLSPEKRAKIDKAVLDKLAYIHSIGDMACGKDQGVYAQQMDLYTDYAVKREKHKVIETLDALARDTNKAGRDQFFGPENKESKIAMQVFNVLSRSHDKDVRDKALAVLAARLKDYGSQAALVDQVRDYHNDTTADGFVAVIEGANSLDRKDIHHMFGNRASSLIFVYNALLHDQDFSSRLITATEGVLKGDNTFAGLNETQSRDLRNIHNRDMTDTIVAKNSAANLIARIEKLTKGVVNEVNSNQTETSLIPSFNNRFLSARGDFRFSIAEFFAEMDSHNPATRAQAMEKFLAARTVLELQRVQESIKDNRNEKLINTNAQQQALMLAILHDPSTLGIDDAKRTLQKNIDSFCKSPEGQQLIANHSVQVAAVHEAYRNHHIDAAIKSWNSTHLTASELIVIGTKDEASRAFLDRQMTYSNELDSAARALISPLRRFLDNGVTSLTPLDSSRLAQSLELINQRNPNPQSTDGLIKMTITNDPSIINGLNSSNDITKITAVFKLLVAIRNSALEPALRDSAYSFVAQGLGSSRVLREADLLALRSDSYRPGYNADVNAVNLADLLDTRSQGADAVATAINSIIGGVLSTLLNDLRSGDPELESHAIAHISHDIANDPASADLNHLLEIDSSIKWDIMRSAYSSNTMTRCDFDGITRMANNLSALERYSRDIDGTIANDALEPLLRDLFIKTQSVNPQVDPRNMKSTHVQNEVREENQHNLNLLKSLVDDNITRASRRLPTFVHRVRIAHLGLIGEITDSVFKKAIV